MTANNTVSVNVWGDVIEVYYTGCQWVSPCNGQQHASDTDALRAELRAYYRACGDDTDSDEIADEIEAYVAKAR